MAQFDAIRPEHVLQAIEEHDQIGRSAFLARHGFPDATGFLLRHDGRDYDSKAVLGVAHRYATGTPLRPSDFSGGRDVAARRLSGLGFEVVTPLRLRPDAVSASTVGRDHSIATWALAARGRLLEAAGTYRATVSSSELAEYVQERSLIHTNQQPRYWLGDVLGRVAEECVSRGEPILGALCIDASGSVLPAYAATVTALRGERVDDPDEHAAHERLDCHRYFRAPLPPDGGEPVVTRRAPVRRERVTSSAAPRKARATSSAFSRAASRSPEEATARKQAKPLAVCPVHFTQLPATGICDLCE
ncbi:hypothetical protein [Nocardioides caldifontis]|uniref:hypothetical protein n=1 Tax=Nocardioides caldifontis TaxID=2588938 RepID=UPI00193AAE6F|nr:hypothetical protein [Nocardioides caldifontis]